jgi:zinc protease
MMRFARGPLPLCSAFAMPGSRRRFAVALATVASLAASRASCAPPRRQTVHFEVPERHATLPNGMRVILLPDPSSPLVEVDMRYAVGAAEDPQGKSGLAHVVEHMVFLQRPAGADMPSSFSALAQVATFFNANTTWDSTHFVASARPEELGTLLAIEGARLRLGCETVTPAAFARELEVVRNENREKASDPDTAVFARIEQAVYPPGHAYHRPVGGDDAEVVALGLDDVCRFTHDYYVPENATLVISGNIDEAAVSPLLGKYFAGIPARPSAPHTQVEPLALSGQSLRFEADVGQASVSAVYALPPTDDAYGVVGEAIERDFQSEIYSATWRDDRLATGVDVEVLGGRRAPLLFATVWLRDPGKGEAALAAIHRAAGEVFPERLIEGPGEEEAKDVVALRRSSLLMRIESLYARARAFADWAPFAPDAGYLGGALARLGQLDEPKLRELARTLLASSRSVAVQVIPKAGATAAAPRTGHAGATEATREIIVDPAEAAAPLPLPPDTVPAAHEFTLGNGLHVVLAPTGGPLPVMSVRLVFKVGWANEPAEHPGIARAAAGHLGGLYIVGYVGGGAWSDVDAESTVFGVRGLNIYDNLLIEGLERWVKVGRYGRFDELPREVELEAQNRDLQASLRFESAAGGAVFGEAHPYARTGRATPRSARGLDLETVRDFGMTSYVAGNATLVVTGNFDPVRVESIVRDKYGSWDHGSAPRAIPAPAPLAAAAAQGPRRLGVAGPARPSLRVRIEFPAPAIGGGHAGRLILAEMLGQRVALVRQRLGASYGVHADLEVHAQGGAYVIEGRVDAGRAGEALAAMREGLESLRRGDDFDRGFALARRVVLAQLEAAPTTAEGLARLWADAVVHGLGADFHAKLVHAVATAQPAQVKALVASDLDLSREVIVILGAKDVVAKAYADAKLEMTRWIE